LGALWALEHGLDELLQGPVLDKKAFEGLRDTGEILKHVVQQEGIARCDTHALDEVIRALEAPPDRIADALRLLRRVDGSVKALTDEAHESADVEAGAAYWAGQMDRQVSAWLRITDRYLTWIEILDEKTEEEVAQLCPEAVLAIRYDLSHAPSLLDLANGHIGSIPILESIREVAASAVGPLVEWLDRLLQAFAKSKYLAGEMLGLGERLIQDGRELSESINMRFLYDRERRLFSIGYNVSEGILDNAYYDLLASEARLGSFVAIARGDVPIEHWFSMSRPYSAIGQRRVLLSWNGTMFEYLMPLIFQRSYGNSLLDKTAREAVAIHNIKPSAYRSLD
jgi:cyclic beta-1,2-glucan synthetase